MTDREYQIFKNSVLEGINSRHKSFDEEIAEITKTISANEKESKRIQKEFDQKMAELNSMLDDL